jgi:hypothetical protein
MSTRPSLSKNLEARRGNKWQSSTHLLLEEKAGMRGKGGSCTCPVELDPSWPDSISRSPFILAVVLQGAGLCWLRVAILSVFGGLHFWLLLRHINFQWEG